jgi:copper resistance protein B
MPKFPIRAAFLRTLAGFVSVLAVLSALNAHATAPEEPHPDWPAPMESSMKFYSMQFDQLEWRVNDGADEFRWDLQGWWGTDENKLWLKSEGEANTSGASGGDAEFQLLYSRMISPYWDAQVGIRQDVLFGGGTRQRTFAVLGLEGLAPFWFDVEPALFISDDGDVSFRLTTTYDLYVTQRLVAQPRFEMNAAAQDARKFGVESGVNDVELGLRLRYEIRREFAPYVGVHWSRQLGDTADLARSEGEDVGVIGFVLGVRIGF